MNQININEGLTNNYLITATFGCLFSVAIAVYLPIVGIPLLILSTAWYAATNGLEISEDGTRYRRYAGYLGLKLGRWRRVNVPKSALLILSSETTTLIGALMTSIPSPYFFAGSFYGKPGHNKSLTYDIVFIDEDNDRSLIYEFLDYKHAKEALKAIETHLKSETEDRVAKKLAFNRSRRTR